jgi:hypothetical protein
MPCPDHTVEAFRIVSGVLRRIGVGSGTGAGPVLEDSSSSPPPALIAEDTLEEIQHIINTITPMSFGSIFFTVIKEKNPLYINDHL